MFPNSRFQFQTHQAGDLKAKAPAKSVLKNVEMLTDKKLQDMVLQNKHKESIASMVADTYQLRQRTQAFTPIVTQVGLETSKEDIYVSKISCAQKCAKSHQNTIQAPIFRFCE